MGDKLINIITWIFIALGLFAFAMMILCVVNAYGEFEYTTANGEKGTATSCIVSFGSAHCTTEDGTELIVESFRKVK